MPEKLTISEKKVLDNFIKSVKSIPLSPTTPYIYAGIISLLGLVLLVATVIITSKNINEHTVLWVFIPGVLGGAVIILLGVLLLNHFKKLHEKKRLAKIIEKLLKEG